MGVYDTIGTIGMQVKATEDCCLKHYNIGDKIDLANGMYICYEGWFVVDTGIVFAEGEKIFDKWGVELDCINIVGSIFE